MYMRQVSILHHGHHYIILFLYSEVSLPYIFPGGYNASLNGDPVKFTCILPDDTRFFKWIIDGDDATDIGQMNLSSRGITYSNTVIRETNRTYIVITIKPRAENNNITLGCDAVIMRDPHPVLLFSDGVVFRVQGMCGIKHSLQH